MCSGREFRVEGADTEKARGKVASNTGWFGTEICFGRTQGSGQLSELCLRPINGQNVKVTGELVQQTQWKRTDGRTDTTDRTTLPAHAVDNCRNRPSQRSATLQSPACSCVSSASLLYR